MRTEVWVPKTQYGLVIGYFLSCDSHRAGGMP